MARLLVTRLLLAPLVLLGVILAIFVVVDLSPNDPARAVLGLFADQEARNRYAIEHGLNDPLPIRFARFIGDLAHFDMGRSLTRPEPIGQLVGLALPITIQLALLAAVIATTASVVLALLSALHEGGVLDRTLGVMTAFFQAAPQFWIGVLIIQFVALRTGLIPPGGYVPNSRGFGPWFRSIIAPAITLALPFTAAMTRVTRASIAEELQKDYVRTATGAGVSQVRVLLSNVLRNALVTPITVLGVHLGALISGSILVETVFNIPGMGSLLILGVQQGDLGVVRGVAIVVAAGFIVLNLLVDVAYLFLNPRARLDAA